MTFDEGLLTCWNNGGYRGHVANADKAGLPMGLFDAKTDFDAMHAKKPDYIVGGSGHEIDWGRRGPPK